MKIVDRKTFLALPDAWQPMETAPRNGTKVLATDGENVFEMRFDGRFGWMHSPPTPAITIPVGWLPYPTVRHEMNKFRNKPVVIERNPRIYTLAPDALDG